MKKNRKISIILTFLFVFVTIFSNIRVQAQENHKKIKVTQNYQLIVRFYPNLKWVMKSSI